MQQMPSAVKEWASDGRAESSYRLGKVDTTTGQPADYRHLMTPLPAVAQHKHVDGTRQLSN